MVTRGYNRLLLKHTDSFIGNGSVLSKPVQTQLDLSGTFQQTHGNSQESVQAAG